MERKERQWVLIAPLRTLFVNFSKKKILKCNFLKYNFNKIMFQEGRVFDFKDVLIKCKFVKTFLYQN